MASWSDQVRVGCDVQSVADVEQAVAAFGERYLDRVFSARERAENGGAGAASLAARFAAKEAVLKLLGSADGVDLRWVEVLGPPGTRPHVHLREVALERHRASGLGPVDLSLSHDGGVAFAVAVAVAAGPRRDPNLGEQPPRRPGCT